jgi:hypothetical protein
MNIEKQCNPSDGNEGSDKIDISPARLYRTHLDLIKTKFMSFNYENIAAVMKPFPERL